MKTLVIRYFLVLVSCLSLASELMAQQGQLTASPNRFLPKEYQVVEGMMKVYYTRDQVFLEIPENMLERECCIAAQVNRGFGWRNRYIKSIGVVSIRKGPGNTLCFYKGLFQERLGGANDLLTAFEVSNQQPLGLIYPIVAFRKETSAFVIDISKSVTNGDDWFLCSSDELKGLHPSETRVEKIVAFEEGLCFTIKREYGTDSPLGSGQPVEISCVIRILPVAPLAVRYAEPRFPYASLAFTDYGKIPYGAVRDSLICRWRLTASRPLICNIDPLCPPEFVAYIEKSVRGWAKVFETIGCRGCIKVQLADSSVDLATQKWVISYDLGKPRLERSWIVHPETGEIVYARLNIGHGVLLPALKAYWWECGAMDERIRQDRMSTRVAGEILQQMVSREVGLLLGLLPRTNYACTEESMLKNLFFNGRMPEISDEDYRHLAWGYRPGYGGKKIKADRRPEKEKMAGQLFCIKKNIENRKVMFSHLKQQISRNEGNLRNYKDLYDAGLGYYCCDLESLTGLLNPETFPEVMECLDNCLWNVFPECLDVMELRRERWLKNEDVVAKICRAVFQVMLEPEILDALKGKETGLLQELHSKLWGNFDTLVCPSAYQMEVQRNFLNLFMETKNRYKIEQCRDDFSVFWWEEWHFLYDKFEEMSQMHRLQIGRDYYHLLWRKMKRNNLK